MRLAASVAACALGLAAITAAACSSDETTDIPTTTTTTTSSSTTSSTTTATGGAGGQGGSTAGSGGTGGTTNVCDCTATALEETRGSAIAVTPDDSVVVAVNRDLGTVSVAGVTYDGGGDPVFGAPVELTVGAADSEPWQVAIDACGKCAYVVTRKEQQLVRIEGLDTGTPTVGPSVQVGSEPTGVALTPNGSRAYVANWVEGTLSIVDPLTMAVTGSIDLNDTLLTDGYLGTAPATPRPGLAHPRAIAISNNGDAVDTDETVVVTEWFAQRIAVEAANGSNADVAKAGLVYTFTVGATTATSTELPPVANTQYPDHTNGQTGCYPNQIASVTISGGFAYITSTCDSPKGPTGAFQFGACQGDVAGQCSAFPTATCFNGACNSPPGSLTPVCTTNAQCGLVGGTCITDANGNRCAPNVTNVRTSHHPALSVLDIANNTATTENLDIRYDGITSGRMPLLPTDLGFKNNFAYLTAEGADAAFRATITLATGTISAVGAGAGKEFINMRRPTADTLLRLPIGIAVGHAQGYAFVANYGSRDITAVELNQQAIAGDQVADFRILQAAALPTANTAADRVLKGRRFFVTGLGRWSQAGSARGSCEACHIDGLTDNVTWYFPRGPRQSVSLDGTFDSNDPTNQRILNWTAIFDEIADFELNIRGVSGGVGAIVNPNSNPIQVSDRINLNPSEGSGILPQQNLTGSAEDIADPGGASAHTHSLIDDWNDVKEYIQTVRSPRRPVGLDTNDVAAGKTLFTSTSQANCVGCHSGPKWTISTLFYTPGDGPNDAFTSAAGNSLQNKSWDVALNAFPAALLPSTAGNRFMRFGAPAGFSQIQCILRPVGTFGVAPATVGIAEVRENMTTAAQGNAATSNGYNPPSLLGMQVGAPYFHAGQARTLEEVFDNLFQAHFQSPVAAVFAPTATQIRQLVAFVMSLDEDSTADIQNVPPKGATGGDLCFYP